MSLRIGSQGAAVAQVKERLKQEGAKLDPNAIYGLGTAKAVMKFQKEHGLKADGVVGHDTAAAMGLSGDAFEPAKPNGAASGGGKTTPKPSKAPANGNATPAVIPTALRTPVDALRSITKTVDQATSLVKQAKAEGRPLTEPQKVAVKSILSQAEQILASNGHLALETGEVGQELNRLRVAVSNLDHAL